MKLLLLSQDLMIGSHLAGTARTLGLDLVTVYTQQQVISAACEVDAKLLLIDLRLPGLDIAPLVAAVHESCAAPLPMIACAPHVHEAKLEAARAAGCDAVITRGQLDRDGEKILAALLADS